MCPRARSSPSSAATVPAKSTLLRAVSRTLGFQRGRVTSGSISYDGRPLEGLSAAAVVAAGVVQVPEGRQVFARMTVADNLRAGALGATGGRRSSAEALARVHELFPVLADRAHQRAGLLSGGEQQMLAMGRALMARPRLLLLDEPSLGLAPLMAARIAETVQEINAAGDIGPAGRAERGDRAAAGLDGVRTRRGRGRPLGPGGRARLLGRGTPPLPGRGRRDGCGRRGQRGSGGADAEQVVGMSAPRTAGEGTTTPPLPRSPP